MDPSSAAESKTDRGAVTRANLISAATVVVSEAGYSHATTKAIAAEAGVSEGTIYRHFPDKTALFMAAILRNNAAVAADLDRLPERAGIAPIKETLIEALILLSRLRDAALPLELALRSEPDVSRSRALKDHIEHGTELPGPPGALAAYLRAEQSLGRIRADLNCEVAAISLMATLFGLALLPQPGDPNPMQDAFIESVADIFLRGVQ